MDLLKCLFKQGQKRGRSSGNITRQGEWKRKKRAAEQKTNFYGESESSIASSSATVNSSVIALESDDDEPSFSGTLSSTPQKQSGLQHVQADCSFFNVSSFSNFPDDTCNSTFHDSDTNSVTIAPGEGFNEYTEVALATGADEFVDDVFLEAESDAFDLQSFDDPVTYCLFSGDDFDEDEEVFLDADDGNSRNDEQREIEELNEEEVFAAFCEGLKEASAPDVDPLSNLKTFLREWSLERCTPLNSLTHLLHGLKSEHPECFDSLPSDARTIMNTPTDKLDPVDVPPGKYIHLGLLNQFEFIGTVITEATVLTLLLLFNIDGMQLFENSSWTLWPILVTIASIPSLAGKVFAIGLYYGPAKPKDFSVFLKPFVDELKEILMKSDVLIKGQFVPVRLLGFCCDTPARSSILETVGHTGYFSCFRCTTKGKTISKRRCFPNVNAPLREDNKFRNRVYKKFQPPSKEDSALLEVPSLHFCKSFVLDTMHMVFIGCTKAFLTLWVKGKRPHKLRPALRQELQDRLERCIPFIPAEFSRKPREIHQVAIWKATELRLFLLYLAPVLLKGILPVDNYLHFLELSIAMTIYHSRTLIADEGNRKYAKSLLVHFVQSVRSLYGEAYVSHNCHSLIHLPEDVEFFRESIDNFTLNSLSAFPFENFMSFFKRFTRGRSKALQQIVRRLRELFGSVFWRQKYSSKPKEGIKLLKEHKQGPKPLFCNGRQYKVAEFPSFTLSSENLADCTCGTDKGTVILVQNFIYDEELDTKFVVGRRYLQKYNLFAEPVAESSKLGI
ncbi:uncharacterized protein [Bemisia tabaci]|uniref:uncharacterized protein n=1 Tax=Bemisia tabaci TaxID=7038 RepID=UPI003B27CA8A